MNHSLLLTLMFSLYYATFSFLLWAHLLINISSVAPLLISEMGPVSQTVFPSSMGHLRNAPTSHL